MSMTPVVSVEKPEPVGPDVFLSFATRHRALVDTLREQAENRCSALTFRDYATRQPVHGAWQPQVERLIRASVATLCLVGETTWQSDPVNWEIRKSAELGKRVLAVYLQPGIVQVPAALREIGVTPIPWDIRAIVSELHGLWRVNQGETPATIKMRPRRGSRRGDIAGRGGGHGFVPVDRVAS